MLKHSVQIELFLILWVTKLIYSESPMYTVLDKDTIKNEILPHLSKAKRGYVTQSCLIEVVNAILYKLKTGCQWAFLPVEALFSGKVLSYGAVYHHDVHDIEKVIGDMFNDLEKSHIRVDGLFLNADAGFDCDVLRGFLCEKEVIANICINKRRENADDIFVDDELYAERYSIERTYAWMDSFRTLLNRFDTTVSSWMSWNYLAFAVLLLKKISRKQKV